MSILDLGGRSVGSNQPCFIIAEAGVNHDGETETAHRLIDAAASAGADAVKFQTFGAERVVSRAAPKAGYQLAQTDPGESQLDMLRRLQLSDEASRSLHRHCAERGVVYLSTPFDEESADFLADLGVPAFKIGSGEITNWPLLEHVARKGRPVLLSTGMSSLAEVDEAVRVIRGAGCPQLALLHCVSSYPADPRDANLRAIGTLSAAFGVPVGYSDHTPGIAVSLAATALGACIVEKHFTLSRERPGPDHRASLEPSELRALVAGIRTVELALGDGHKNVAPGEAELRDIARRSLAAACAIGEGTTIVPAMLRALRPATGISPVLRDHVVGRKAKRSLAVGELLSWDDLE